MKNIQNGNVAKIMAVVLISVMLIFMIGIVVNGWQHETNGENSGEVNNSNDNADNPNGDTSLNEGTADNNTLESILTKPQFTNYLTGLGVDEENYAKVPYVFSVEPNAPLYGISSSELTFEIPTDNGDSRFLIYCTDISKLGKIGAIAPTRDYISQILKFYGGILVANGEDDIISYSSLPSTLHIDLSKNTDSIYKENGKNIYTDNKKLETLALKEGYDLSM